MSTIPQSTTPRTDAAVRLTIGAGFNMVYPSFARELETELAHLNDEVERLKKDNLDMGHWIGFKMYEPEWDSFKKSLEIIDHWKARAEKAEAELANIANAKPDTWGDMSDSFQAWAQNRARHALAAMTARAEKAEAEAKQLINAGVNN